MEFKLSGHHKLAGFISRGIKVNFSAADIELDKPDAVIEIKEIVDFERITLKNVETLMLMGVESFLKLVWTRNQAPNLRSLNLKSCSGVTGSISDRTTYHELIAK